jgi:hypothetical protein
MARLRTLALLSLAALLACGDDDGTDVPPDLGGVDAGSSDAFVPTDAGPPDAGEPDAGEPDACVPVELTPERPLRPVDVVLVVDNSASMADELAGLEATLNDFAGIFGDAAVDMQLIAITDHGSAVFDLCVPPPLSGTDDCSGPPVDVPGQFRHYDLQVSSGNAACLVLDTLFGSDGGGAADENGNHAGGWVTYLREGSARVFIAATDDGMACEWTSPGVMQDYSTCDSTTSSTCLNDAESTIASAATSPAARAAENFRDQLLNAAPAEFAEVGGGQRFTWHSLVSLAADTPDEPYVATDPLVTTDCSTGAGLGSGYQWLSKGTGGLRAPVCNTSSYGDYLEAIADATIAEAPEPCAFAAPDGEPIDGVRITPVDASPVDLSAVTDAEGCSADDEYFMDGDVARLCPLACDALEETDSVSLVSSCGG